MREPPRNDAEPAEDSFICVRRLIASLVVIFCVVLLFVDAVLLQRNSELQAKNLVYLQLLETPTGKVLPPLSGVDINGKKVIVLYGQDRRATLLFAFSPECGVCTANWPNWEKLLRGINKRSFRLVFINTKGPLSSLYVCNHAIGAETVIAKLDPQATLEYRFFVTPETVLIRDSGEVEKVWAGALTGQRLKTVEAALWTQR